MKKLLPLLFLSTSIFLLFFACKGKKGSTGDTGPMGPGGTFTFYTGTVSANYETVSTPALTSDSIVDIRVSTETNKWLWMNADRFDYSAKTVSFFTLAIGGTVSTIGGEYRILVQDPS